MQEQSCSLSASLITRCVHAKQRAGGEAAARLHERNEG